MLEDESHSILYKDLELSVVSGVETRMSKSDIKISKCYVGFLTAVGKVFRNRTSQQYFLPKAY